MRWNDTSARFRHGTQEGCKNEDSFGPNQHPRVSMIKQGSN